MARLEEWLDRRYPNACTTLDLYSAARQRGEIPTGARGHVEKILQLILFHARRDEPYRSVLDWRRLRTSRPDLPIEDLRAFQTEAEQVALNAAHQLLDHGSRSSKATLASQTRTAMRRALRHWLVETELLPDPRTGTEMPSAETIHVTAEDVGKADDGKASALRKMLGREGLGVVEGGHSVTVGPRVVEEGLRPEDRCLQCGQRNLWAWWYWQGDSVLVNVLPGGEEVRRQTPKLVGGSDFQFCGLRCEAEFYGRSRSALSDAEVSALARAIVAAAGSDALGNPGLTQARAVLALTVGDGVLDPSDGWRVRREVNRLRSSRNDIESDPATVLSPLEREIWELRNEGYGSVERHLRELAQRGIRMTAAAYRKKRARVVRRVNEAAAARRVLGDSSAA